MTGCERCNTVNTAKKHVYIVLFKGDDSDFAWNQNIEITLETEMDLTGFSAKFSFMDFTQEFADITSKKLVLVFPAAATSSFPLGAADASVVLYDANGKARTIANRIHMIVTKCVDEAYANEDPQAITVSISGSMEREQADWDETDTQSPSYIRNKPAIPSIDATLTHSGEAADAKAVGDALRSGFTEWVFSDVPQGYSVDSVWFETQTPYGARWAVSYNEIVGVSMSDQTSRDATDLTFEEYGGSQFVGMTATRHLVTPTKTSQLTNDGAPNGGGTPYATTAQIPDVTGKADKVANATAGNLASLTAQGDLADSGVKPSDFATPTDLPYALVVPGEWSYAPEVQLTDFAVTSSPQYDGDIWNATYYSAEYGTETLRAVGDADALSLDFGAFVATRASLPGHLLDRAGNRVVVSGDTTLTLPSLVNAGKSRDFYVRLTVSAAGAGSTVAWAVAQGETWDAIGAPPSSFASGTYLYHITEVAPSVWHAEDMFAVAGKMPMYPMVAVTPTNGTLTVAPYTVSTYTAGTSAAAFTVAVGADETGKARDGELVIDCTAAKAVAPTVTWPATFHPRTDAATDFACEAGVRNVYYISEYATGQYVVGGWQETAGGNT